MIALMFIYIIFTSVIILYILNYFAIRFHNLEVNYCKKVIPIGSGLVIPVSLLTLIPFVGGFIDHARWLMYCLLTLVLGAIGFIDDRYGTKSIKGIRGHLLHLKNYRKLTSGLIKMVVIITTGFSISVYLYDTIPRIFISTLTFAMWTNIFNFLDVRPARALKGFWIVYFIMLAFHFEYIGFIEWSVIIVTVLLFFVDIMQKGMLGDAGSNILGGIVGYWLVYLSSVMETMLWLLVGLLLTYYAEKKSFSLWIEKHPLIRKIDRLGLKASD